MFFTKKHRERKFSLKLMKTQKTMKNFLPFLLTLTAILLLIPLLAYGGKKQSNDLSPFLGQDILQYRVLNHKTNEIMTLTPKEYIRGVVAAEMPITFHSEAIKSQTVAAHTYALRQIDEQLRNPSSELRGAFLTTDYTINQAYLSDEDLKSLWGSHFESNYAKLTQAVDSVIDEILVYNNKPIIAAFHSISSGKTESAFAVWGQDVDYLIPVNSEGDELSPNFETITTLTPTEIQHAFTTQYPNITFDPSPENWFSITQRSDSGTVLSVQAGSVTCSGKEIREILKLRSANFTIEFEDNNFQFTTLGYGHGVGMSQYGADYLARQGKSYEEILSHYYQGATLQQVEEFT